jgi:hypothetical protein
MSYYKYVKRDEKSRVDWGAITTNLVDTLREQEADREKQREAIDASSRATGDILSDAPQGENKAANEWILNASSDASQYLMSQNRLLKSGLLDPREFTVNRQNVEDSFSALQDVSKNAQQYYKETMDRIENNESIVGMEGAIQEQLNKFQNWSKTQAFVNPTNGKISIGMLNKDGGLSKNASEFSSIEGITNRMRSRYDRYDYSPDLQSWIDGVGKDVRVVRKKGVLTLSDASQDAGFQKALDEQVGALVDSNPIRVVSILEELGLIDGYDIDGENTTQKGDNFNVAMKNQNDGIVMPEVTDDMKAKAREFLSGQMLNMLDKEQTPMPEDRAAQAFNRVRSAGAKDDAAVLDAVGLLYSGGKNDIDSAVKSLAGLNPNIQSIQRTNRGVTVIYKDGKTSDLPFYKTDGDGNVIASPEFLMDGKNWTTGAAGLITGITEKNYNKIAEESSWNPMYDEFTVAKVFEPYDESDATFGFSYGTTAKDPLKAVQDIKAGVTAELFASDDEATVANSVSQVVSKLGFNVEGVGRIRDVIKVTNPVTGESVEIRTSDSETAKNNLLSFINSQVATAEDIMRVNLQSGGTGTIDYGNL